MTKQDIFNYVMHSPYNTNPNQLATMLENLSDGEGGEDMGVIHITITMEDNTPVYGTEETAEELITMAEKNYVIAVSNAEMSGTALKGYYIPWSVTNSQSVLEYKFLVPAEASDDDDRTYISFSYLTVTVADGEVTVSMTML